MSSSILFFDYENETKRPAPDSSPPTPLGVGKQPQLAYVSSGIMIT
jgi:hypothetical protein